MRTVRFTWPVPPKSAENCEGEVYDSDLKAGTCTPTSDFPGLAGVYNLLHEEMAWTINPEHPLPTFLHESYAANIETWMMQVSNPADEIAAIGETRDALTQLVDSREKASLTRSQSRQS
ncbi:MAG: hypothetical protein WA892_04760 [Ornithinimicrobium sp.]